jgi:hypothetical protein
MFSKGAYSGAPVTPLKYEKRPPECKFYSFSRGKKASVAELAT